MRHYLYACVCVDRLYTVCLCSIFKLTWIWIKSLVSWQAIYFLRNIEQLNKLTQVFTPFFTTIRLTFRMQM